jgi:hypothetical protein
MFGPGKPHSLLHWEICSEAEVYSDTLNPRLGSRWGKVRSSLG